ncbi:uncharacterized protein LOC110739635 [Chenopodium quinoa]|uniref:uncharacterized protein LOC110739635 n=1 Tax=Chenopodium quinoa TaxID=63459 RepID=UPI000B781336|nr:uncharacterized protein LOC110739635 [Chenopodium quinoa]
MLDELKVNLLRAQQVMKGYADSKRREGQFEVGDSVFLKLQPYRQKSLAIRPNEKLAARYYGPFTVVGKVGKVAYRLDLPPTSRIHPVFHISQLKKAVGDILVNPTIPIQLTPEMEMVTEPEAVLDSRKVAVGRGVRVEVLIKWQGLPEFEATWEDSKMIIDRFPAFHLEDKVNLEGAGIVVDPNTGQRIQVYTRRPRQQQQQHTGQQQYTGQQHQFRVEADSSNSGH